MTRDRATQILETYSLTQILEDSDLEDEDVLLILHEQGVLKLPETEPL